MANTYYDSQLTAEEIEQVLEAISGILTSANNGKVLAISDGTIEARSVQWGGGSAVVQPLSVTQNGTYNPPSGVDGYAPVTVNVSGGGGAQLPFSPHIRGQSFIGSNNTIVWSNANWPEYHQFWLDLLPFQGITIRITNSGNRNVYGFTASQPLDNMMLNNARADSGGSLQITYDGGNDRYLVYDFTTSFAGGQITFEIVTT